MNQLKITLFAFAATAAFAPVLTAADSPAAKTTVAVVAQPNAKKVEDRSFENDFAGKKTTLVYFVEGRENPVVFKEIRGKNTVFTDQTGSELVAERGSNTFKFSWKEDTASWRKAQSEAARGDVELALEHMRPIVYPMLPFAAMDEGAFDANEYIEPFVSLLLQNGKLKEAAAVAKSIPVELAQAPIINTEMEIAKALAENGDLVNAMAIVERVDLRSAGQFAASDSVLDVMGILRRTGKVKELLPLYAKLGGVEANPQASWFKLWSIYCDVAIGNRMSADVYLGSIKIARDSEAFSLAQMIKGDLKATDPKAPKLGEALDIYAEGIVFGKISSEWMPELLYKAGMTYKKLKKFVASNEIFAQMNALYPQDSFTAKGLKEIVKVEKKVVREVSHDDDEDEDEDEDYE